MAGQFVGPCRLAARHGTTSSNPISSSGESSANLVSSLWSRLASERATGTSDHSQSGSRLSEKFGLRLGSAPAPAAWYGSGRLDRQVGARHPERIGHPLHGVSSRAEEGERNSRFFGRARSSASRRILQCLLAEQPLQLADLALQGPVFGRRHHLLAGAHCLWSISPRQLPASTEDPTRPHAGKAEGH